MVPMSCALSADEGGARCFENTGDYHVPKLHDTLDAAGAGGRRAFSSSRSVKRCSSSTLSRSQLDDAGDSARLRRAGGRRTFSSSLSMKRCSSSTLSRKQARCAEAGGSHDSFESSFVCCADPVTRFRRVISVMHHNLGLSKQPSRTICSLTPLNTASNNTGGYRAAPPTSPTLVPRLRILQVAANCSQSVCVPSKSVLFVIHIDLSRT